ncbi:glycoside hydrolase [Patescibacteria group bacterium]|nr:glycoside hydrolase [Patescibacteria group bacterium]
MGITKFIEKVCAQTAVYWGNPHPDGYGGTLYDDPVEVHCRWDEKINVVKDRDGKEVVSKARLLMDILSFPDFRSVLDLYSNCFGYIAADKYDDDIFAVVTRRNDDYLVFNKTIDGGKTWTSVQIPGEVTQTDSPRAVTLKAVSASIFIVGFQRSDQAGDPYRIVISTDGGATWAKAGADCGNTWSGMYQAGLDALDVNNIVVAMYAYDTDTPCIMITADGGITWIRKSFSLGDHSAVFDVHMFSTNSIYVLYEYDNLELRFAKTADGGINWTIVTLTGALTVNGRCALKCIDENNVLAVFSYDGVTLYKSIDAGTNWTTKNVNATAGITYCDLDAVDMDNVLVAFKDDASNDDAYVSKTDDGGDSWDETLLASTGNIGDYIQVLSLTGNAFVVFCEDVTNTNLAFFKELLVPIINEQGYLYLGSLNDLDSGQKVNPLTVDGA